MKQEYLTQLKHLEELNNKVTQNHGTVNTFYQDTLKVIDDEKEELVKEREKLHLETKKFNK